MYTIREKIAYSKIGKLVATVIRNNVYKQSRIHWVQQAIADADFSRLSK
jgi:hypothetical protein